MLLGRKGLQEGFGHQRNGQGFALHDVGLVERGFLANRTQRERALGLRTNDATEDTSVFHGDGVEVIRSVHDGVRIHNILQ